MRSIENKSSHNKSLLELLYPRHEFTQIFSPVNLNFEKEKTFPTLFPPDPAGRDPRDGCDKNSYLLPALVRGPWISPLW